MIQFLIPINPVPKGRPRFSSRGHAYTPETTRDFEKAVKFFALNEMRKKSLGAISGPIGVSLRFGLIRPKRPKNKEHITRPDIENLAKSVLDALNEVCYLDDSQICELYLRKIYSDAPHIYISIHKI